MKKQDVQKALETTLGRKDLATFSREDYLDLNADACNNAPNFDDEYNPAFILSGVPNSLLALIAEGKINLQDLAAHTLKGRGYDLDGNWIGFKK